jgi:hypothetical protein
VIVTQDVSTKWGRLAVAAVAIVAAMGLVLPASALAKAATRIVVTSKTTVDWSTPGITPAAPAATAKLQKKVGSKWVALSGTVKIYYAGSFDSYVLKSSPKGSSVKVTMPTRGKYKLVYAGSTTAKPCTAYTKRLDKIGESIQSASLTIGVSDGTWTPVTASFMLDWNTEAFPYMDYPLVLSYWGSFQNADDSDYSGDVYFAQQVWDTGEVWVTYRVRTLDIPALSGLKTTASILSDDDYVVTTIKRSYNTPIK